MYRLIGALATSLVLLGATIGRVPTAFAGETWCDTDPPIVIVTPGGNTAVVYIVDRGPIEHLASLLTPQVSYSVKSVEGGRASDVRMTVTIPNDVLGSAYGVGSEVWSGPARLGTQYDAEPGTAGAPIELRFRLALP